MLPFKTTKPQFRDVPTYFVINISIIFYNNVPGILFDLRLHFQDKLLKTHYSYSYFIILPIYLLITRYYERIVIFYII